MSAPGGAASAVHLHWPVQEVQRCRDSRVIGMKFHPANERIEGQLSRWIERVLRVQRAKLRRRVLLSLPCNVRQVPVN